MAAGGLPGFRADDPQKNGAEYKQSSQPNFPNRKATRYTASFANLELEETRKDIKATAHCSYSLSQLGVSVLYAGYNM